MKRLVLALLLLASSALAHAQTVTVSLYSTAPTVLTTNTAHTVVGTKFKVSVPGYVIALRFYRTAGDTITSRSVKLWTSGGTPLANIVTTNDVTGWNTVHLPQPIFLTVGATYVVSYFTQNGMTRGHYAALYSTNDRVVGVLTGPKLINGVYIINNGHVFPNLVSGAYNGYAADVVYLPGYPGEYQ